jgi:guanylate kinase
VNQLRSLVPNLEFSISYTTRAPRGSEQEGHEYHFTTRAEFERMIAAHGFLEYAEVFDNYYGTARRSLTDAEARGKDLLLDIDVQGAALVLPPNPETLGKRLRNRSRAEGVVSEEVIDRRLAKARQEIENFRQYGYILVNDVLDQAVEELSAIVISERARSSGDLSGPDVRKMMELAETCRQANAMERLRPVLISFGLLDQEAGHA